jgi:hypothetical protein
LRIPYGLDRLPRDLGLRCVEVGDEPLRLNSEPVPADTMPLVTGDHAARVAAAAEWLESLCGDYAPLRRQFVAAYFRFIAAQIETHREEVAEHLKPYDGLYVPEDFIWSALRPLPRGWVPAGDSLLPADIVFWDGTNTIAVELAARETEKQKVLQANGAVVYRIEPAAFDRVGEMLPESFQHFWQRQLLPSSPFLRLISHGVLPL